MFNNYLLIINGDTNYTMPLEYMNEKSYKCTWSTMDLDSYRDANGVLHRNAVLQLPHCSFDTRPLTNTDVEAIWSNIRSRYVNPLEKNVLATVYIPETDSYYTGLFYVPDTEITIDYIREGKVFYSPITFEFIGYGDAS